ncbi:Pentatricopeptide repeat-containing protein, chloroplastic [Neolecta irregularis DAH-3]|uniref:Pentatricopeptide repeat-containing protein, chloroplastic n=1 Tax=Neolecta irregularis (strain DAH-3) TaxID=1198029 RepID=A0A1U7LWM4_NEOID|nr:Pentatricopeptide repeat-containing protein, chloroplastic [Neolecta irregularis DAH-3]|eukprot:OLL27080.1 Pentatricopeptide repeat-containing protein, chloroplastic [Neolecta irregularis DAH-3]
MMSAMPICRMATVPLNIQTHCYYQYREFSVHSKVKSGNSQNQQSPLSNLSQTPIMSNHRDPPGSSNTISFSQAAAFYQAQKREDFMQLPKHIKSSIQKQRKADIKEDALKQQLLENDRNVAEVCEKTKTITEHLGVNLLDFQSGLDLNQRTLQFVRAELASLQSSEKREPIRQKLVNEIEELKRGLQRHVNTPIPLDISLTCKNFRPRKYIVYGNSQPLDSKLLNILRLPGPNVLTDLAHLLFTTPHQPTSKSFNIMIRRLTILRLNSAAWLVFHAMLLIGLKPDPYTISSLLRLTAVTNDYLGFREIVRLMRVPGMKQPRNMVVYGALIDGCVKFGKLRYAAMYVRALKHDRLIADLEINTSVLQLCTRKKLWEPGFKIWQEMQCAHIDERGFHAMYRLCRSCRKFPESQTIVLQAREQGFFKDRIGDLRDKTKGLPVHSNNKTPCYEDLAINKMPRVKDGSDNPLYRSALQKIWRHI